MAITITAVRGLIEELELRGHSSEEFCASVDLDPSLLEDPNETIPHEQLEQILDRNPGLAGAGVELPIGTVLDIPVPTPREPQLLDPIRLW